MPLVFALYKNGYPLKNGFKLVYANSLIVYYSFQHAIAFFSRGKLIVRPKFYERRRVERKLHIAAMYEDLTVEGAAYGIEPTLSTDFFGDLCDEMVAAGLTPVTEEAKKPRIEGRRRVRC